MVHIPVLLQKVVQYLDPKPNQNFIDATIDGGGHTAAILERNKPQGKVLGIEVDPELYQEVKTKFLISNFQFLNRLILVNDNFKNLKRIVENTCPEWNRRISGVLFDLGMSSWHLEKSQRGFSFRKNEVLDMRYNCRGGLQPTHHPPVFGRHLTQNYTQNHAENNELTARDIVNQWPQKEIEGIIREYGEERYSRRIAKEIVTQRQRKPILTTLDLVEIIQKAVPKNYERGRIHPATRTFQALRIIVNQELENLKAVLPQTLEILDKGGRIVVISFHSLEDRIVKNFFREKAKEGNLKILTKKPVRASGEEIQKNPRARSAKLRAAIKLAS